MHIGRIIVAFLAVAVLHAGSGSAGAQAQDSPKVGLALSGGGARGFAHVSLLRVLEEEGIPIHGIAGASMGSIIGGLYAIGYAPDELEHIGKAQNWEELFAVSAPRRRRPVRLSTAADDFILTLAIRDGRPALPSSLVSGQRISTLLARLTAPFHGVEDFRQLPIPFLAIAADLETGEAVRLESGHLPTAIRASISIPSALAPVEIDGRTLIDGAVARNLPAEDVLALGADIVLCSNTSSGLQAVDSLESITDVLNQTTGFPIEEHVEEQKKYCNLYFEPWLDDAMVFDFGRIDEIIEMGYASADSMREQFRRLRGKIEDDGRRDTLKAGARAEESYRIEEVQVPNVDAREARRIKSVLKLDSPADVSVGEIEAAVERVYASGPYRQVIYRLLPDSSRALPSETRPPSSSEHTLLLDMSRRDEGRLGFDVRYDSRYKASLLFSASGRKVVGFGSTLRAALRLGEFASAEAEYVHPIKFGRPVGLNVRAGLNRYPIDRFDGADRAEQFLVDLAGAEADITTVPFSRWSLSGGVRAEYYGIDRRFGTTGFFKEGQAALGPEFTVSLDTHDRGFFPRRGQRVRVQAFAAVDPLSSASFSRLFFDWQPRWPISSSVTVASRIAVGSSRGDVPLHHRFFLGGAFEQPPLYGRLVPLFGASTQELSGAHMQSAMLGIQVQVNEVWLVMGRWNGGWTGSEWDWSPDGVRSGFGITVGRQTFLLPAAVTISARSPDGPYELQINLGRTF